MAICSSCGSEVSEASRFCSSCGKAVQSEAFATRTVAVSTPRAISESSERPSTGSRTSSGRFVSQGQFAPGDMLGGRYRIVAMLGKGGMGEVYRADDLTLDQAVALKFLPEVVAHNERALARFRNEVRVARQVSHPNVCRVYDFGEVEGHYFLSMEYVDGEDLASLLRRIGRLPHDKALEIARKLCAGLAAAHEKGILHRDLKPANVMLDGRGQVLLTDFGLAGLAEELQGAEVRNGTPAYMAPEQLAGAEVTVKSDIYALGLVLYEIFTGKLPFESNTLAELMRAQRESAPVSPSTLVRDLDPTVERVILRCLQAKPGLRPASALAVAAALPGGDPLAAALAAGETPSPEMVAAAGQGEGLAPPVAVALFAVALAFAGLGCALLNRGSALERLRPEYSPEVLAQKARDTIQRLGLKDVPRADDAYGFSWNGGLIAYVKSNEKPSRDWSEFFSGKPPLLRFWYRQSAEPLTALTFHDDLLTPGQVDQGDPPLTQVGMIRLMIDSQGRLLRFERIPKQRETAATQVPAPDWNVLFAAAALDPAQFQPAEPLWNSLGASDARRAWIGTWPGSRRPIRVEAAAMRGRPVYFNVIEPWATPDRQPSPGSFSLKDTILVGMLLAVMVAAPLLARSNLRQRRGDRQGAFRLAALLACVEMAVWLTRSHMAASEGTFGMFVIATCTSVFYGVVIWTIYIALEPYVRRHWPQTLISWSSLLIGRFRDPVVGRDVLIGTAVAGALGLLNGLMDLWWRHAGNWAPNMGSTEVLLGTRRALGMCIAQIPHGIRDSLFYLFLILLFRVLLRSQWLAAAALTVLLTVLDTIGSDHLVVDGIANLVVNGALAFVILRWGLLPMAVTIFVATTLSQVPVTANPNAWYFAESLFVLLGVAALTAWGFRTAIAGQRPWKADLF